MSIDSINFIGALICIIGGGTVLLLVAIGNLAGRVVSALNDIHEQLCKMQIRTIGIAGSLDRIDNRGRRL